MSPRRRVQLWVTDAGGGHRASAQALQAACQAMGADLEIQVVNVYREIWGDLEPLKRLCGFYAEDVYNFTLDHDIRRGAKALRALGLWAAKGPNPKALQAGLAFLKAQKPDLCVSLLPFVNDSLAAICASAGVPLGLVVVDLHDQVPFMWYTPGVCRQAAWVTAPTKMAAEQARAAGAAKVLECGLPLHPRYLDPAFRSLDRQAARRSLGLDPERQTLLLGSGSHGANSLLDLIRELERDEVDRQVVVVCGHNQALQQRLSGRRPRRMRLVPIGFTDALPQYLRAADLTVGKTGPGSFFEAVAAKTPLLMDAEHPRPHELPNAELAERLGLARVVRHRQHLLPELIRLSEDLPARLAMEAAQGSYPLGNAAFEIGREIASARRL